MGNIEFMESDAFSLDFPHAIFDAAVSRWGIIFEPDAEAAEAALAWVLHKAADLPPDDGIARHLERWDPVITDVAAACQGDQDAAAKLGPFLDELAKEPDWAALVAVLRRILSGERGENLLDSLDPVDTAIARQTLALLADGQQEPC